MQAKYWLPNQRLPWLLVPWQRVKCHVFPETVVGQVLTAWKFGNSKFCNGFKMSQTTFYPCLMAVLEIANCLVVGWTIGLSNTSCQLVALLCKGSCVVVLMPDLRSKKIAPSNPKQNIQQQTRNETLPKRMPKTDA